MEEGASFGLLEKLKGIRFIKDPQRKNGKK
jgi:hypothetical protein